ncbi:Bifunctional transcriptional activator/DNA repair enzyme AdaA [Kordia antarctica]|uniref:Bifunctional transcriptional activator/DNA repair enzyme AdaA n=1 Tax=Kordia antarctica TaxID=1218801 RepID=A0A7L4ZDZ3_9FLAO|nr:AraC family transcriptional regulator [Kordia antarctica]QHI35002.1 Bifunctional transcriptional activator/DNA repair enzyme AdaA [Kordia antarctica]
MKILSKGEYYGSMNFEQEINGIILSEYDYSASKTAWHYHENPYLMYVLGGNLVDINKKQKTNCSTGHLLLHNWDEPHFNEKHSSDSRGFHIEFERTWFKQKQLDVALWEGSQLIENPKSHHLLAKIYFEFKCQDLYSNVSIEVLLFQLCESIASEKIIKSAGEPLWMNTLRDILHQNHTTLSLKYLSNVLGIHPAHISRAIPKYLKTTLGDYTRQQKIKVAITHLLNSKLSLTEIAYASGFSDQSHFIRVFRIYIGMTPSQFRNKK